MFALRRSEEACRAAPAIRTQAGRREPRGSYLGEGKSSPTGGGGTFRTSARSNALDEIKEALDVKYKALITEQEQRREADDRTR